VAANGARRAGSDLGRAAIDWEQAFAYYASLPAEGRCYQAVAEKFGVSVRTVEKHGRNEQWKQRLQAIKAQAAAETNRALGHARAEHLVDLAKLIEASLIGYAEKLRRGDVRMGPADLDRLHKLWRQLSDEVDQPNERANTDPPASAATRPPEHTAAVIHALLETGTLAALGLQAADSKDTDQQEVTL
jgi:hypothetical protein